MLTGVALEVLEVGVICLICLDQKLVDRDSVQMKFMLIHPDFMLAWI